MFEEKAQHFKTFLDKKCGKNQTLLPGLSKLSDAEPGGSITTFASVDPKNTSNR